MKKITALIRPECLDSVQSALAMAGWNKMTITHVLGRGLQGGMKFMSRGKALSIPFLDKVQIMIIAYDGKVDEITRIICENARTDRGEGDGKIFITECEKVIKIKNGAIITEANSDAVNGL